MIKLKLNPYIICFVIECLLLMGCEKEGPAGKHSLIDQITVPASTNCAAGGYKIITGLDENRNNELDSNEIQKTQYVCNDIEIYNKETIIYFRPGLGGVNSTTPVTIHNSIIHDFNIANYAADSISFGAHMFTHDGIVKLYLELYDFTNGKVINNATLSTSSLYREYVTTPVNFINELPKSPIKLGLRIYCDRYTLNGGGQVFWPVLKLYKK
jgi:hypothetical protein